MNLTVTYNKTTGAIKLVVDDVLPDLQLQLWKFSYAGNELLGQAEMGESELDIPLGEDGAYRIFAVLWHPLSKTVADSSENLTQLHVLNSRQYINELLARSADQDHWIEAVAVLRVLLIEAQMEYSKGNLLGATNCLTKIKDIYNTLSK